MRKRIIILTTFLAALFGLSLTAIAQGVINLDLLGDQVAEITCDGNRLVLERESRIKVKAECKPNSTTPTDTPEPEPSDTPEPDPTDEPSSSVPLCESHDSTQSHALYDPEKNCRHTHTHNGNPHDLDYIFGPVGAWHNGQSISYPWHTPNENELKHEGYKWEARELNGCVIESANPKYDTCITAWRLQFHSVGGPVAATTRLHSYSAELRVCTQDGTQCGTIKTGGWADFGILTVPYKGTHIPLPDDPPAPDGGFDVGRPPYRGHNPIDESPTSGGNVPATWNSGGRYGYNGIVEFDFRVLDDWQGIDPNDPGRFELLCPDFKCEYNHSLMGVYEIVVKDALPADSNGLVNFTGYTDRQGNIVTECGEIGVDCIPLIVENMPAGKAIFRIHTNDSPIEYDTSLQGEYWIEYPN